MLIWCCVKLIIEIYKINIISFNKPKKSLFKNGKTIDIFISLQKYFDFAICKEINNILSNNKALSNQYISLNSNFHWESLLDNKNMLIYKKLFKHIKKMIIKYIIIINLV